jgi:hypothetical protein
MPPIDPDTQPAEQATPRVCMVMPVRNGRAFLNEAIQSLASQAGAFRLRIHVQDGGSTDGTLDLIQAWQRRLDQGGFAPACHGLTLTWDSTPDRGMYDAIQRGFAAIAVTAADILGWLNCDDLLMPGAIQFACHRMDEFPEVSWLTGRPCEADASGVMRRIHAPIAFNQELLGAGLHDGRHLPFVMQEGSFWRGWLWERAGGLRPDLRLAGDFDLWRRLAQHAPLYSTETVLAVHRRHAAQLSAALSGYEDEIDAACLTPAEQATRDRLWAGYGQWTRGERPGATYTGPVIVFDPAAEKWGLEDRRLPGPPAPLLFVSPDGTSHPMEVCHPGEGFTARDGPYPHLQLPAGFGFAPPGVSTVSVNASTGGEHLMIIRFRNFVEGLRVRVRGPAIPSPRMNVPVTGHAHDGVMALPVTLVSGRNELPVEVEAPAGSSGPGLLVLGMDVLPAGAAGTPRGQGSTLARLRAAFARRR